MRMRGPSKQGWMSVCIQYSKHIREARKEGFSNLENRPARLAGGSGGDGGESGEERGGAVGRATETRR